MRRLLASMGLGIWLAMALAVVAAPEALAVPTGNGLVAPPTQDSEGGALIDESIAEGDLRTQVMTIVNYFVGFTGLAGVVAMVYFGFLWITAGADEEQFTNGRKGILYVSGGILLILMSYAIVSFLVGAADEVDINADGVCRITASPNRIVAGEENSVLTWALDIEPADGTGNFSLVSYANGVASGANGVSVPSVTAGKDGSVSVSPSFDTEYVLTASDASAAEQSCRVWVYVEAAAETSTPTPYCSAIAANPTVITSGESSTLSWVLDGGTINSAMLSGGEIDDEIDVLGQSSYVVTPNGVTAAASVTYTLELTNSEGGGGSCLVNVNVNPPNASDNTDAPRCTAISATPITDGSTTVTWSLGGGDPTLVTLNGEDVEGLSSITLSASLTTTYTLVASNAAGSSSCSATANLQPTDGAAGSDGDDGSSSFTSVEAIDSTDTAGMAACPAGGSVVTTWTDGEGGNAGKYDASVDILIDQGYVCNGAEALVETASFATSDQCPTGGVYVYSGLDNNPTNGELDQAEITAGETEVICNGDDDTPVLVKTVEDENMCEGNGGVYVYSGLDDDNPNGELDDSEIDTTQEVCNGASGETIEGADGTSITLETTDAQQCGTDGGVLMQFYDSNGGFLSEEVVCNGQTINNDGTNGSDGSDGSDGSAGASGASVLYQTSDYTGDLCPNGGTEVIMWTDTNGNGQNDDGNATTEIICDGESGTTTTAVDGSAGTDGISTLVRTSDAGDACPAEGGVYVEIGEDSNRSSTLDNDEITSSEYVCNGTSAEEALEDILDEDGDITDDADTIAELIELSEQLLQDADEAGLTELSDATQNLLDLLQRIENGEDVSEEELRAAIAAVEALLANAKKMRAVISATPNSGRAPLSVSLSGLSSSSPKNETIPTQNFSWRMLDVSGNEIAFERGPVISHRFTQEGVYSVELTVTSSQEGVLPGRESTVIRVLPARSSADFLVNGAAVGRAYRVSLVDAADGLTFDPSPSTPETGIFFREFLWDFSGETFSSLVPQATVFPFGRAGDYPVSLRIFDESGAEVAKKTLRLQVEDSLAKIAISPALPRMNAEVTLDASGSSVSQGDIATYMWEVFAPDDSVTSYRGRTVSFIPRQSGDFRAVLRVASEFGQSIREEQTFSVAAAEPVPLFMITPAGPSDPARFAFDARESTAAEGGDLEFLWDFDGDFSTDAASDQPFADFTYPEVGTYFPRLVVRDAERERAESSGRVVVESTFGVDFLASSFSPRVGDEVLFTASSPSAVGFSWDFGDGMLESHTELEVPYVFTSRGLHVVKLTALRPSGEKNTVEKVLFVGDRTEPLPVVSGTFGGSRRSLTPNLCGDGMHGFRLPRSEVLFLSSRDSKNISGGSGKMEFSWTFPNGDIVEAASTSRRFSMLSAGDACEELLLTARDIVTGKSATTAFYVRVENTPPIASRFTSSDTGRLCETPCRVSATLVGARDPDGAITAFRWWAELEGSTDRFDSHITTEPYTVFTLPVVGPQNMRNAFTLHVSAEDTDGGVFTASENLGSLPRVETKNGENPAPIVDFSMSKTSLRAEQEVSFSARSSDPLGEDIPDSAHSWDLDGDGQFDDATGAITTRVFGEAGNVPVSLLVSFRGHEVKKTRPLFVGEKIEFPQADFLVSAAGLRLTLDASPSLLDPELPENSLRYTWDTDASFDADNDGDPKNDADLSGIRAIFEAPREGRYDITLTATNAFGKPDSKTRTLDVTQTGEIRVGAPRALRSPVVSANFPLATLELAFPKDSAQPEEDVPLAIVARDIRGGALQSSLLVEIIEGDGLVASAPPDITGSAAAKLRMPARAGNVVVRVTVDTAFGPLSETLAIPVLP